VNNQYVPNKWQTLILLAIAELLGMSVWFSASAVVPALSQAWALDDAGRAWLAMSVQIGSGTCALGVGFLYGQSPLWLIVICLVWGFAVVADSAQFSAAISEMCRAEYTGTALILQTSLGFLLTLITIRLIPTLKG
jgi:hypothetical protein